MARIRSMKPEYRTSLTATQWPREVRLFFSLLWGYLDDHGYGVDEPRLIKPDCFPLDDDLTFDDIDKWIELITSYGSLCRFRGPDGRRYLHAPKWAEHQRPQHPASPRFPECKLSHETVMNGSHETLMTPFSGESHETDQRSSISAGQAGERRSHESLTPEQVVERVVKQGGVAERAREAPRSKPAATLLANSLLDEHKRLSRVTLPRDVTRMTGEAIDSLLDDPEITPDEIKRGLAKLRANPRLGPRTLPVLVNEIRQLDADPSLSTRASPRQEAERAERMRALERARARDAQEG
jgi:hypothetical protein